MNINIKNISLISWFNKNNEKEIFEKLTINPWEIISIVWPTWSWKSRLLSDIEYMANNDTLSYRKILINEKYTKEDFNYWFGKKLTSQLSQNMNFVMDISVYNLLGLHADSMLIENKEEIINKIIDEANNLSWEKFSKDDNITSLSWWQSRALMIADIAFLSNTKIILIDEIENAWINKEKALQLLIKEDKIVFISTHDPIIALNWNKRLVIKNWWIIKIIETSEKEKQLLKKLQKIEYSMQEYKELLRSWEILN